MTPERKFPFKQPTKKETLADKQQKRIRRWKLNHLQSRFSGFSAQWWVRTGEALGAVTLFGFGFYLLLPFFGHEDRVNVFSAPVIPLLATATEFLTPFSYGVRLWLLVFLVFFPLSFYYFVREVSGRKLAAFLSSFIVILPLGIFLPARIALGLFAEDGGHIASLALIPLASLALLKFLRQGNFWIGVFASGGTALVALISPIGLIVLGVFMGTITFSEMLLGQARLKLIRLLAILTLAAGFSAFWYHPKFVLLTFQSPQGQLMKKTFFNLLPVSFFLVPILGVFGFLLFENRPQLQPMFIAFFLMVGFGLFSLGAGIAHPAPSRFLPAFGISLAFLLGLLLVWFFDFLRTSPRIERFKVLASRRKMIAFGLVGLIFGLILMTIFWPGRDWSPDQAQVLGLTAEQKVGIWEIREGTSRAESILGWVVTSLTILGTIILRSKII